MRVDRGWTLEDLSAAAKVARSTISKIENGQQSPTLEVLQRLAIGLELSLSELFNDTLETVPPGRRSVLRANSGPVMETKEYAYEALAADLTAKKFIPLRMTIRVKKFEEVGDWIRHDGEEFVFVLSGEICVYTEYYQPSILKVGDSVYLDSRMGHVYTSIGPEPAEVLLVCTQTYFEMDRA